MTGFEIALTCLALNIFKEARGESIEGQLAVAMVVINRVKISKTKDICEIVFEDSQFSWTTTDISQGMLIKGKKPDRRSEEWTRAMQSARDVLGMKDFTKGATHYHNKSVTPSWAKNFKYVGTWGEHLFYVGDYK